MGCNSEGSAGASGDTKTAFLESISNLGKGFLDIFVAFGDMVSGTLGIKADTTKGQIGAYFTKIAETMGKVKEKLKGLESNANYEKIKGKVDEFVKTIESIEAGANKAASGASDGAAIGDVVEANAGTSVDEKSVKSLVEGIKAIVDLVIKEGDEKADKTKPLAADKEGIGKLFGDKNEDGKGAEEKHVAAANASIGAVSGADILKAIAAANASAGKDGKVKDAKDAAGLALAKGTGDENDAKLGASIQKDAIIAAGIALRAMAKEGKFIVKDTGDNKTEAEGAKGVAANAVGKVLNTLTIAIRNTVDEGLKEINKVLGNLGQGESSSNKPAEQNQK